MSWMPALRPLELKMPPLVLCAALAATTFAMAHWVPAGNVAFPGHRTVAALFWTLGIVLAVAGVLQFRRAQTTVNPLAPGQASAIVTSGIYRYTRNPMYLGMAALLLGVAAWSTAVIGYLCTLLFCVYMTQFQIKPEERALLAKFGTAFASYMQQVRRWL